MKSAGAGAGAGKGVSVSVSELDPQHNLKLAQVNLGTHLSIIFLFWPDMQPAIQSDAEGSKYFDRNLNGMELTAGRRGRGRGGQWGWLAGV